MQAFSGTLTSLVAFLALCAGAAATGVFFRPGNWYKTLDKPSWTPPDWLFGPVWTVLYIMIAVAGWIVWSNARTSPAMTVWFVQLGLNAVWSFLFFGLHLTGLALLDIGLMWLASAAFAVMVWPFQPVAAWLFVPYLGWLAYAFALNFAIWQRNP
ncbi:MAG: TspO/MBR family protein [Pseudomonadota bacterium]|nr:TspO/MBR family protein [Pseudomonadota bacterium]